jgi:hypothetical protein
VRRFQALRRQLLDSDRAAKRRLDAAAEQLRQAVVGTRQCGTAAGRPSAENFLSFSMGRLFLCASCRRAQIQQREAEQEAEEVGGGWAAGRRW